MRRRSAAFVLALTLLSLPAARAQHGGAGPPLQTSAPPEARQLDFLVGQWELVAMPKVSKLASMVHGQPKMPGVWKAWRALDGFGIEDELRLTDDAGNPRLLSRAVRVYDRGARRWSCSTLDVYRARFQSSTGEWKQGRPSSRARWTVRASRTWRAPASTTSRRTASAGSRTARTMRARRGTRGR